MQSLTLQTSLILDGLWQFQSNMSGLHLPCSGYIICFGNNEICLIDPPADMTGETVLEATGCQDVAHILLTHVQEEHGAGIRNFPEAAVHVPTGDEYLCRGRTAYEAMETTWAEPWDWETRGNYQGHLGGARNERPLACPVSLGTSLRHGEIFQGFEILETPGHGKNAVTLLARIGNAHVAFCGDLIYGAGRLWNWFDADWDYGLQKGQQTLQYSAQKLAARSPDLLCPAHGPIIRNPAKNLALLDQHLAAVLEIPSCDESQPLNFPAQDSAAPGFRMITPHIHQWKIGNTIVITSDDGRAGVVDDGLCLWEPLPLRIEKHDAVFREMKAALGIDSIDWIIPTHYHGDHTEFIPRLAESECSPVIALDSISGPMEFPESYNLACMLPWYGTVSERLTIHQHVPEGYVLYWAGYELRFFHLGGQTKHHLGVEAVVDGLRVLFVGDAWWGNATTVGPILCWNEANPEHGGWIYAIDRMLELQPDLLVCGHGSALRHPMPYLRAARSAWKKRLDAFAKLNPRESTDLFFDPFLVASPSVNHL